LQLPETFALTPSEDFHSKSQNLILPAAISRQPNHHPQQKVNWKKNDEEGEALIVCKPINVSRQTRPNIDFLFLYCHLFPLADKHLLAKRGFSPSLPFFLRIYALARTPSKHDFSKAALERKSNDSFYRMMASVLLSCVQYGPLRGCPRRLCVHRAGSPSPAA